MLLTRIGWRRRVFVVISARQDFFLSAALGLVNRVKVRCAGSERCGEYVFVFTA